MWFKQKNVKPEGNESEAWDLASDKKRWHPLTNIAGNRYI